jgi:hypothetical protein
MDRSKFSVFPEHPSNLSPEDATELGGIEGLQDLAVSSLLGENINSNRTCGQIDSQASSMIHERGANQRT